MKHRWMFPRILLVLAASAIAVNLLVDQLDLPQSPGTVAASALLLLLVSAPPLYMFVVRHVAQLSEEYAALSAKNTELGIVSRIGSDALQGEELSVLVRRAAEELRRALGVQRCVIWLFGDVDTVVDDRVAGLPSAEASFPPLQNPESWKEACRAGRATAVDDVKLSPSFAGAAAEMELLRIRSLLAIPLCGPKGTPVGVAFLCRTEPSRWNGQAPRIAEAAAQQLAAAVRSYRAFRDNKELTSSLLSLMDHVPGLVYRGHRDWSLSVASAEVEKMTGYAPKDFLSGTIRWKNLIHPDDLESVKQTFRNAVQSGRKVLRVEYRARHRNGSWRWLADRRQLIYDDRGRFLYVDGLCLDITDRKKGETAAPRAVAAR